MAKYKIIPSSRNIVQSPISIGHKAEKGVEAIEFDLTAWVETYGSGTLTVIMRRWGDAIPYPIALEIDENNKATWTLSDTDTAKAGMAYAQLSYIVGETVVKKSDIYTFRVMDSLTGEGEPPEAYESWLEHLQHLAAEAMAEVLDIEGIVTDKTLTVDGGIADAKATGEALAGKVDAADHSELSDRVGANTIALAEKADRSTTYTKAQVDQMIEDVEVETDTTLEIDGAPADAAETGRQIGLLKADLDDTPQLKNPEYSDADLYITDPSGNVIAQLADGGIEVKQFNGTRYKKYTATGSYTGTSKTVTITHSFKKGDRIVLHVERGAMPWDFGALVAYKIDTTEITPSNWRGDCVFFEYTLPKNVSSISAVFPTSAYESNFSFTFEIYLLGDVKIEPTVVTIKKDGTGNYMNLKDCLADIGCKANDVINPYRIEIYPGTYDVLDDYTEQEKAAVRMDGSVSNYTNTSFVGAKLLNGMHLVGIGKPQDIVLTASLPSGTLTDDLAKRQRAQISALNMQGSCSIENLTIVANYMRYCVHDDFGAPYGKKCRRTVKNCIFRGIGIAYVPHTTYGAGMQRGGTDFLFENCDFGGNAGVHTVPSLINRPTIKCKNCKGHGFRIGDSETNSTITEYTVYDFENCDFLWISQNMGGSTSHVKVTGRGAFPAMYAFDTSLEYNTGEIVMQEESNMTVGTVVEMYTSSSAHGMLFRAITSLDNFAGIVVFNDGNNALIQIAGYIKTDRLGLSNVSTGDLIGLSGTSCAIVNDESLAFGKVVFVSSSGNGYVKIRGWQ